MDSTAIGQAILFATTILGFCFQLYRESRNRKWDLEDRDRARKELEKKVETVKTLAMESQQQVLDKIDQNTIVSEKAFHEANNVNQKILDLSKTIDSIYQRRATNHRRRDDELHAAVESTQATVEETKHIVESIDKKV